MNKFFKILEIVWLVAAISSALVAVYFLITKDFEGALYFVFVFIISGIMYLLRKHQRVNQQKINEHNANIK
jgi:MFS-type transporter involved in bile tolerance (Atg22 family)